MGQEKPIKVDVSAIMSDIRRKLQEEDEASLPSFESIPIRWNCGDTKIFQEKIDRPFFLSCLDYVNYNYEVPYYHPLGDGRLKVFIKRIIRKLIKCVAFPILTYQNKWNMSTAQCLNQLAMGLHKVDDLFYSDDNFYHDFEERFRGSEGVIHTRLQSYVPILKQYIADWKNCKFVDIGCGRGEWLDVLRENGASDYIGVDLNTVQCAICEKKGHQVVQLDCIQYLSALPEDSVDLVSGFQIVEHLHMSNLIELLQQCLRVLKPGGVVLFETPNPQNLMVGANTFYIDPTHKRPLDYRLLSFLAERCGYEQLRCIKSSPHPAHTPIPMIPNDTDTEKMLVDKVNGIIDLLYGPQDYALLGVKPK